MTPETTPSSSGSDNPKRQLKGAEERLMVAVRIRPLKNDEPQRCLFAINKKNIVIEDSDRSDVLRQRRSYDKQYSFDVVFGENSTQEEVYKVTTSSLVQDVLNGYNATVFAYGPTGAGKTHTMVGDSSQPGIMVRALNDIFEAVKEKQDQYSVSMSYLELYNEQIRDLLNPSSGYLELREDSRGRNIQVAGLQEISTTSTDEVMQLLQKGNKARTIEPTAMNKTSSRSHALLSVTVKHSVPLDKKEHLRMRIKQGRLFMIDLAGSERANKTKNRGKRLQEGAHINRSLLALGNCINALSGGARYVNYRDSKLTRLLKEALSGNCRTVMIAHVSPSVTQKDESRNTLIYADRANNISTKAERNVLDVSYHVTQYQTVINELRDEISRLQQKMNEERPRSADVRRMNAEERSNEVKKLREQIVETFKTQMKLRRKLMEIDSHLLGLGMEAERQHLIISHWESRNNKLYKNSVNESRARTQQSIRRRKLVSVDGFRSAGNEQEGEEEGDFEVEGETAIQQAWGELGDIEREQERWSELRSHIEQKLEVCRQRGVALEDKLPSLLSSDDEREILALMCRVHELEADKMALQSERLVRQHELRRRDLLILRYDRQRQLCEEIITRQRQLIEEGKIKLPPDLQELYQFYQQEIHAATYTDLTPSTEKLPPISKIYSDPIFRRGGTGESGSDGSGPSPPSSADSDDIPALPTLNDESIDRVMGQVVSRPGAPMRLPPLPPSPTLRLPRTSTSHMRRAISEDRIGEGI
ncbi:kinesin-like protein KIF19 [Tribolium castaneum]|uniref:Kinesin-like protein n=1 Tax=Tribolium castaneum TaxID=7070 RepID=D6WWJ6_TRICA|nr:PREDICTED: kinesin-like protein KIF19 [Tribolium castaneum]EFA08129.2 Bipolar kinesin KRP-130-like Protein [Tribolium castaneum]|eukprot:XP_008196816.2 PREDICTED: kinesin-like protein KIF19 [Tribolium castaneum]